MAYVTVTEAATQLGITPTQVRALARKGELVSRRDAERNLLVDADSVAQRARGEVSKPISASEVWDAALCMTETPENVPADKRHRYRKRLTDKTPDYLLRALSRRKADSHTFVADTDETRAILAHETVIPTGASVHDPLSRMAEAYVTDMCALRDSFTLVPASTGNLVLHELPEGAAIRLTSEGEVPELLSAADAAESISPSARSRGRERLTLLSRNPEWSGKGYSKINNLEPSPDTENGEYPPRYHDPFSTVLSGGQSLALWGKTDYWNKDSRKWGLLVTHLSDAGRVAAMLWDTWLSRNTRDSIVRGVGLPSPLVRKLLIVLAATHDVGKASPAFENQVSGDPIFSMLIPRLSDAGLPLTKEYISSVRRSALPRHEEVSMFALGRALPRKRAGRGILHAKFLAAVVGAHHGYFPVEMQMGPDAPFGSGFERNSSEPTSWTEAQDALVLAARALAGITEDEWQQLAAADIAPHSLTLLSGIVVMADWISSNTDYFPLGYPSPPMPSPSRTDKAWSELDLTRDKWAPAAVDSSNVSEVFAARFPSHTGTPRPAQRKMVEAVETLQAPGLLVLEAPTGVGKTEAALLAAEALAHRFGCDGVMFALPTRATSNASYDRVNDWLEAQNKRLSAHLTHGKAQFNKKFTTRLERFARGKHASVHDNDDNSHTDDDCCGELNTWFNDSRGKHLADFTVGTVDQILLASATGKHISVRHLGLSGKVVVLDEVHASDTYMASFLVRTLRWLGEMGVPVIALTATLTPSLRRALHNAYSGRSQEYMPDPLRTSTLDFPDAEDVTQYPVISVSSRRDTSLTVIPVEHDDSRSVKIRPLQMTTATAVAEEMLSVVGTSGCSALIFNTVSRAQKAYNVIKDSVPDTCEVLLLHSRFTGVDRARLENRLLELTGRPREGGTPRPDHLIVISTQVIEQSLDVDFDVMYSDLAPIDLLVQRMGRLHRHRDRTDRDPRFEEAALYVGGYRSLSGKPLVTDGSFSPWVYSQLLLMRTAHMLDSITEIVEPQDLSDLMRKMDQGLELPESWSSQYEDALRRFVSDQRQTNTDMAQRVVEVPKDNDVPWRSANQESRNTYTPVRKGVPNVELVIVFDTPDGLVLPLDGEHGQGWRITGNLFPELVKAIALRSVPMDVSGSRMVRDTGYGPGKRGRHVPSAVMRSDIVPEWEHRAPLRGLGLLVLTPDDTTLTCGEGVIRGTIHKKDEVSGKVTSKDFEYRMRYDTRNGLQRFS